VNKGLIVAGVLLVAALAWLMMVRPDRALTKAAPTVAVPAATPPPVPDAPTPRPRPRPAKAPDASVDVAPAADGAVAEADGAADKGPWTVDLGEHRIHLKERDRRVLEVQVTLTTESKLTIREIRGRRRALIRMMFFLGTHRSADGALSDSGGERFRKDLAERYRNVIKTGEFSLSIERFEVFKLPPKDAGE
jgi:hypothetical protein